MVKLAASDDAADVRGIVACKKERKQPVCEQCQAQHKEHLRTIHPAEAAQTCRHEENAGDGRRRADRIRRHLQQAVARVAQEPQKVEPRIYGKKP